MRKLIVFVLFSPLMYACNEHAEVADSVWMNGTVYTVDDLHPLAEAIAVRDGRILKVGSDEEIAAFIDSSTLVTDLSGKFIYPGFIDGHAHIMGIGANLLNVDLSPAQSYDQVIKLVRERAEKTPHGEWIIGRGWHQDKWENTAEAVHGGFPTHHRLSKAVPDHPVWLAHASSHAGLANARAMELAGISKSTPNPAGGEVLKDVSGNPTGIFNETAEKLITRFIPEDNSALEEKKLKLAIEACVRNGLTGLHQAGSDEKDIALFQNFAEKNQLKLRLYVMLNGNNQDLLASYYKKGPQIGLYNDRLSIRAIKLYADGALGSRGAWLLADYEDAEGIHGHNITPPDQLAEVVNQAMKSGFQVCTHAIGDRANREVLDIYEQAFESGNAPADHRFRIEHAQHLHPDDIPRFAELGVIPAIQAIHMSSDRPWAIDRLGRERIASGAYVWKELIEAGTKIINGTDAPVEPVNPIASFYASVSRKTLQGKPEGGYEPAQKMSRAEALKSYTIWAAYGAFMEAVTGSVTEGKLADFTILDQDIMTIPESELLKTNVYMTVVGGEIVYQMNHTATNPIK